MTPGRGSSRPARPGGGTPCYLRAPWLRLDARTAIRDAGLVLRDGRIARIARGRAARARARSECEERLELEGGWLTSGLIDAHAHLELGALRPLSPEGGFAAWVGRILEARAGRAPRAWEEGALAGAWSLVAGGTTAVGDVDSTGAGAAGASRSPLPALTYREVLDAGDPRRTESALASVAGALDPCPALGEGISPHAPFTVSPPLLRRLSALVGERRRATVHWSESEDELRYLLHGRGPLAERLGPSPRRSGLDLLEEAGLLSPHTSLVHGNFPAPGEAERLARRGVVLVHCPGTHAHFDRAPFPLETYRSAGVRLALGTDSLASNSLLDMRAELSRFARLPGVTPPAAWEAATIGGAHALGHGDVMGRLALGLRADLCHWDLAADDPDEALEALVRDAVPVRGVWILGRSVPLEPPPGASPEARR